MSTLNTHATALQVPIIPPGTDTHYETENRLVWNEMTRANEAHEFVYEVSWIAERGVWRKFLRSRRKL